MLRLLSQSFPSIILVQSCSKFHVCQSIRPQILEISFFSDSRFTACWSAAVASSAKTVKLNFHTVWCLYHRIFVNTIYPIAEIMQNLMPIVPANLTDLVKVPLCIPAGPSIVKIYVKSSCFMELTQHFHYRVKPLKYPNSDARYGSLRYLILNIYYS